MPLIPALKEAEASWICEFKANLVYRVEFQATHMEKQKQIKTNKQTNENLKEYSILGLIPCYLVLILECYNLFLLLIFVLFKYFSPVPKDRDKFYFKIKQGIEKKVVITVQQLSNKELAIER
jgi:hypothetical protein